MTWFMQMLRRLFAKPTIKQLHEQAGVPQEPRVPALCVNFVARWEGFSHLPYLDVANIPTIGYGFTTYLDGRKVTMQDAPLSRLEADRMLADHLLTRWEAVERLTASVKLNESQKSALTSFAYNVGILALQNSTLLKRVLENPMHPDIPRQFARWNRAGGVEVAGLTNRRIAESNLYQAGPFAG